MKKRVAVLILCTVLLLTTLTAGAQRKTDNFYDDSVIRQLNTVVYCLTQDRYRLVPNVRTVSLFGNETMLEVLAAEVLAVRRQAKWQRSTLAVMRKCFRLTSCFA